MRIGVIGRTSKAASEYIQSLAEEAEVLILESGGMVDMDGNQYIAFSTLHHFLAVRLDQVILVGEEVIKNPTIREEAKILVQSSCVPEEFKIIEVDWSF